MKAVEGKDHWERRLLPMSFHVDRGHMKGKCAIDEEASQC